MDPQEKQWLELLQSDSGADQVAGLRQICEVPSVSGLTVTTVRLAGDRNDEVRLWAAEALQSSIRPHADESPALADLLRTADDGETAYWAATMLGRLGEVSESAVNALDHCVADSAFLPAREQATWALCQIGPPASTAVDTLQAAAENAPPRLQRLVAKAIRNINEAA